MTRALWILALCGSLAGCDKPTDEDCKKAIVNMATLMGTDTATQDLNGEIRRCKGGSKKEAVTCAISAKTRDELRACGFSLKAKAPKTEDKPAKPEEKK